MATRPEPELAGFPRHPRFTPVRRLGSGGMGVVYEAVDHRTEDRVAIKTLHTRDPQRLYRFKQEFRSLREITHPHLVRLRELYATERALFFTMDLVEGVDLLRFFHRTEAEPPPSAPRWALETLSGGPAPWRTSTGPSEAPPPEETPLAAYEPALVGVFSSIALGLRAIHDAGKVHRDIKPSNVMVDATGKPTILDFGLVVDETPADTLDEELVGTIAYMAPEQAAAQRVGPAADWYSFGVMLYHALTGQLPLFGPPLMVLVEKQHLRPPDPRQVVPACPDALAELCMALLHPSADERPTAAAVLECLAALRGEVRHAELERPAAARSAFVGRRGELLRLRATFEHEHAERPAAVVIRGESGIGKTALAQQFLEQVRARDRSAVVLTGRCYEHEAVSFKALDGVIDALSQYLVQLREVDAARLVPRDAAMLVTLFPVLGRAESLADATPRAPLAEDPFERRARAFAALHELLCRIADRHPLVIAIDDMQWCDADSMRLLAYLLGRPRTPAIHLLLTARPFDLKFSAWLPCPVVELDLAALDPDDAHALATNLLVDLPGAAEPVDALARRIAADTAGHPFYLTEMARHLREVPRSAAAASRLDDVVWNRVAELDPAAHEILAIVALAATPLSDEALRQAANLGQAALAAGLGALQAANLIRKVRAGGQTFVEPYHDRVREVVAARLDPRTRQRLNGILAETLETRMAVVAPEKVIYHLLQAQQPERSALRAKEAGDRAREGLAFERAAEFYELALHHGQWGPTDRRALLIAQGEVLVWAGRSAEAAAVFERASEGADEATQLACRIRVADQLVQSGRIDRGLELLFELFAEQGHPVPRTTAETAAHLLWLRVRLAVRGLAWTATPEEDIDARDRVLLELYRAASRGVMIIDPIRAGYFVLRGLSLALRVGHARMANYFLLLESSARFSETHVRPEAFARRAAPHLRFDEGDAWLRGVEQAHEGTRLYLRLDRHFERALELLCASEASLRRTQDAAWELCMSRLIILYCLLDMGDFARLREHAERFVQEAEQRGNLYAQKTFRAMSSILWLVDDDPGKARNGLDLHEWPALAGRFQLPQWIELHARVQIALYEGAHVEPAFLRSHLRGLRRSLLTQVLGYSIDAAWLVGRLAIAQACPSVVRFGAVHRASRRLDRIGTCFTRTLAAMLRGCAALVRGEHERGRAELETVVALAPQAGLGLAEAAARRRLVPLTSGVAAREHEQRSNEWFARMGVRDPSRLCNVVAPIEACVPREPAALLASPRDRPR